MSRICIVTGAYGAIGKAIAEGLASMENHTVVLAGRDASRLESAAADIITKTGNTAIRVEALDLSRKAEIISFAARWEGPLHILVNNHATAPRKRTETEEGIEMQWAANVLGYFWMIQHFHPFMAGLPDTRIINVASYWAGGLDISDPEFKRRRYNNDTAYRQSKQANRMLARAFADRMKGHGITVNACHPGDVNSKLSNDLGYGGSASPAQGATTPLFAAMAPELKGVTGKYFEYSREADCQFMRDPAEVEELYNLCREY